MQYLNLPPKPRRTPISPAELENFFAEGLGQKEIAKRFGLPPETLSRQIANSAVLLTARSKGIARRAKK